MVGPGYHIHTSKYVVPRSSINSSSVVRGLYLAAEHILEHQQQAFFFLVLRVDRKYFVRFVRRTECIPGGCDGDHHRTEKKEKR